MHGEETEQSFANVKLYCHRAEAISKDYAILLENLLDRPEDSILLAEQSRLNKNYQEAKWNCQTALQLRDSAIKVLELDWRTGQKDLVELTEREKMIRERIFLQGTKPMDSLRIMK